MIRLAYARNTISNVIMSENIRHESEYQTFNEERRKTKIEELTKAIRPQQASLQKHVVKTGTCTKS